MAYQRQWRSWQHESGAKRLKRSERKHGSSVMWRNGVAQLAWQRRQQQPRGVSDFWRQRGISIESVLAAYHLAKMAYNINERIGNQRS